HGNCPLVEGAEPGDHECRRRTTCFILRHPPDRHRAGESVQRGGKAGLGNLSGEGMQSGDDSEQQGGKSEQLPHRQLTALTRAAHFWHQPVLESGMTYPTSPLRDRTWYAWNALFVSTFMTG